MFVERLKQLKKQLKITTEELSAKSGIPLGTLNKILSGATSDPKLPTMQALAFALNTSLDYIAYGKCDSPQPDFTPDELSVIERYRLLDSFGRRAFENLLSIEHERCSLNSLNSSKNFPLRPLPLYQMPASAGTGLFLDSDKYELVDVGSDVPIHANFGVRISGDSMSPTFSNGEVVWVKQQPTLQNGEVGIFILNGNAYCKRFSIGSKGCFLVSINTSYPQIAVNEYDDIRIIGKVLK